MSPLEPTQALLLDYLYGLLDGPEQRQVEELLQTSEPWQHALAEARQQQQLLAEASKTSFEGVRFVPPAPRTHILKAAATQEAAALPLRKRWVRWAVAAGFLLAVVGAGSVAVWLGWTTHLDSLNSKEQQLAELRQRSNEFAGDQDNLQRQSMKELRELQESIKALEAKWKGELEQQPRKDVASQRLQVIVTGPQTVQAGAKNEYWIETRAPAAGRGAGAAPAPTRVDVKVVDPDVRDAKKKVVYRQTVNNQNGQFSLELPRNLPVQPGRKLNLQVVALGAFGARAEINQELPLVGQLYLTHLTTDRPLYRPGEVVRFRSLTLDRFTLKPPAEPFELVFTITGPNRNKFFELKGTTQLTGTPGQNQVLLKGPDGRPILGIGAGEFLVPAGAADGEYLVEVREASGKFPPETRKFLVNRYQAPRLNKELEFTRKSYGPGETVEVRGQAAVVAGGTPVKNQPVEAEAFVDGRRITTLHATTDVKGKVRLRFTLPRVLERGLGTLAVKFTDGAAVETIVRPIPLVVNKVDVRFYPEGGDLVADVVNRVYFEVKTPTGKPAEVQGKVVDQDDVVVAEARTLNDDHEAGVNQGLGRFQFTPRMGKTYQLKIDTPIGIDQQPRLPQPHNGGVVLTISDGVVAGRSIALNVVSAGADRKLLVGAYCRGRLMAHQPVTAKAGQVTPVRLELSEPVAGVYRITVFEEREADNGNIHLLPKAERLIYRRPTETLNFTVTANKKKYRPGERVTLQIAARDEKNRPAPAIALVSAVDQSIVKLADDKTARGLPAHFFLTTEIKGPEDLEYADFLVRNHPKAEAALDLLLGTQGWRRFAEQDPQLFREREKNEAERLLLVNGQSQPRAENLARAAVVRVDEEFGPKWRAAQDKVTTVEEQLHAKETALAQQRQAAQEQLRQAERAEASARESLQKYQWFLVETSFLILAGLLLLVGLGGVLVGLLRTVREQRGGTVVLGIGVCALMLLFLIGGSALLLTSDLNQKQRFPGTTTRKAAAVAQAPPRLAPQGNPARDEEEREKAANRAVEKIAKAEKFEKKAEQMDLQPPAPQMAPAPGGGGIAGTEGGKGLPTPPRAMDKGGLELMVAKPNAAPPSGGMRGGPATALATGAAPPGSAPGFSRLPALTRDMPPRLAGGAQVDAVLADGALPADRQQLAMFRQAQAPRDEASLRKQGFYKVLAKRRLARGDDVAGLPPTPLPFVVREYAHQHPTAGDGGRRDFSETLFWQPALVLADGKAQVSFDLSDSVTTFRVLVWGHTLDGRLGEGTAEIVSQRPPK